MQSAACLFNAVICHAELQRAGLTWATLTRRVRRQPAWVTRQIASRHGLLSTGRSPSVTDLAEVELAKFVAAPCQPRASDPLTWWHDNMARFPYSVRPLDVTWRPLRWVCLVNVCSAPLVTLLMTSQHANWLKILNVWFLKENLMWTVSSFLT